METITYDYGVLADTANALIAQSKKIQEDVDLVSRSVDTLIDNKQFVGDAAHAYRAKAQHITSLLNEKIKELSRAASLTTSGSQNMSDNDRNSAKKF
ncbi:WXG100 family type VII secretion target [Amycolatopsis sp. NPDC059021]|uniref:WXG100 family type VII secretion target n=1 Tax=Amycolatopsis sp. NPDC059021 TaxID=3346704 RepID=UPI00366A8F72